MELEAYGHSKISIHALREEGDGNQPGQRSNARRFLSTPSARRATWQHTSADKAFNISIHALREEGDDERNGDFEEAKEFLSTPSARRATKAQGQAAGRSTFLSTPSARRAT